MTIAQVAQQTIRVVSSAAPAAVVAQAPVRTVSSGQPNAKVAQAPIRTISGGQPNALVAQAPVRVVSSSVAPTLTELDLAFNGQPFKHTGSGSADALDLALNAQPFTAPVRSTTALPERDATASITLDALTLTAAASVQVSADASITFDGAAVAGAAEAAFPVLGEQAARVVLLEIGVRSGDTEITRYLSTRPYVSHATDTPANTAYLPVIIDGVSIQESIALDGSGGLTYGDVEIINASGEFSDWLGDVWANRPVNAYIGDVAWARSSFQLIFSGVAADLTSRRVDTLNLTLRDKLQRLNWPMSDAKLTTIVTTGSTTERLLPLTFGECHNVEPLNTSPAVLEYQVHNGQIESIIEVRDNGVPVNFTALPTSGKFTLNQSPYGTITASVQGAKPDAYLNTVADLISHIVQNYGVTASERFTAGDIDAPNFTLFNAANPQPVGLYLSDRYTVIDAVRLLAQAVGAQCVMSRSGKLRLVRIELPPSGTPVEIGERDMVAGSFQIAQRLDVSASVKLAYCRNWTVQEGLQSGIPQAHKDLFAQEWLYISAADATVASVYKLEQVPEPEETLLLQTADATAEANRRLDLRKTPRTVYTMTCFAPMLSLALGDAVTLTHSRYGLTAGVTGVVVGLSPDWIRARVQVEVLV